MVCIKYIIAIVSLFMGAIPTAAFQRGFEALNDPERLRERTRGRNWAANEQERQADRTILLGLCGQLNNDQCTRASFSEYCGFRRKDFYFDCCEWRWFGSCRLASTLEPFKYGQCVSKARGLVNKQKAQAKEKAAAAKQTAEKVFGYLLDGFFTLKDNFWLLRGIVDGDE